MNKPMLKPCPFCGAEGKLFSHEMDGKTTIWWVQCQSSHCLARRQVRDSKAAAVTAWNDRKEVLRHGS